MGSFQAALVPLLLASLWQRDTSTFESDSGIALHGELEMRVQNVQGLLLRPPRLSSERCQHCAIIVFAVNAMVSYSFTHISSMAMSHFKLLG